MGRNPTTWEDAERFVLERCMHSWLKAEGKTVIAYRIQTNYSLYRTESPNFRIFLAGTAEFEALELESDYLDIILGKHNQRMHLNYYPSCPNPDLTLGLANHSDASVITVLMQDDVSGLQVFRNGKWVAVEPIANAFVVNLGDQIQVVSHGRFRSVEHRAITNMDTARISIPTFYFPGDDAFIAPATSIVNEQQPALYRGYQFQEFLAAFRSQPLKGKSVLDRFKI